MDNPRIFLELTRSFTFGFKYYQGSKDFAFYFGPLKLIISADKHSYGFLFINDLNKVL